MDDDREIELFLQGWNTKNPTDRIFIISCFVAALVGILTIAYTAFQWRRNINLSWMKAIARSKKNPKARHKVPAAPHTWGLESVSRAKNLNCCVCFKSMSPSQTLGPMVASDSFIHRCCVCGAVAHLSCSSSAHKDCKCVSMVGYEHVVHQWAVCWTDVADQLDETTFCSYCEEPCGGTFLSGSPIWSCLWCQRLVHVDCHSSMSNETGDICDLGPFKRLILSPLYVNIVKEFDRNLSSGFLSSITHGANEIASTVRFILTLVGLTIVGYGIFLMVEFSKASEDDTPAISPVSDDSALIQLGRPMLMAVSLSDNIFDNLPKAWFIYLFIGIGAVLFVVSCFGCIGAMTGNGCCLCCYSTLVGLLILVELGCGAFIFFDKSWKEEIPTDKTGDFDMIYGFLRKNWNIVRWVALGIVVFEAVLFLLALIVRSANRPADYDSDEEFINPRQQARQPLLNRQAGPATGVPVAGAVDQRPSRNDAWSARMREKYGLDTSEFTYNPSESNRFQQVNSQPTEERSRCTIM